MHRMMTRKQHQGSRSAEKESGIMRIPFKGSMLKALVFDFDGVIVDTETQWYYIYRDWLKRSIIMI